VRFDAKLIINDNVTLAHEILADGVHLGKTDMKPDEARSILGENFIIGGTANTFDDIYFLQSEEVDYIGLGPFRFTTTKEKLSPILGIEGYERIIKKCREENVSIPIIAIGGIKSEDVRELIKVGVYGVAVSSAINLSNNIGFSVKEFFLKLKE
jgi:thiamine-phosphate pyrophosphorylase